MGPAPSASEEVGVFERVWERLPAAKWGKRQAERELLCRNFPLLIHNFNRILWNPEWFFLQLREARLETSLSGPLALPLGLLILLWRFDDLVYECPRCGGPFFALGVKDSARGKAHVARGICGRCGGWFDLDRTREFADRYRVIQGQARLYRNDPEAQKHPDEVFDPRHGWDGRDIRVPIVPFAVKPLSLPELLTALESPQSEYTLPPARRPALGYEELRLVRIDRHPRWKKLRRRKRQASPLSASEASLHDFAETRRTQLEKRDKLLDMPPFPLGRSCPGCGREQVSTLVLRPILECPILFTRIDPHHLCDGRRVVYQDTFDEQPLPKG